MPPQLKRNFNDAEIVTKSGEAGGDKRFGEDIRFLIFGGNKPHFQSFRGYLVTHKMEVDLDMFSAGMEHGIGREVGSSKVVTPKGRWSSEEDSKFLEKRLQPLEFSRGVG
jgi:hypothetical protein